MVPKSRGASKPQAHCSSIKSCMRKQNDMILAVLSTFLLFGGHLYVVEARKTKLTWVNGIAYSLQHMEEGKEEITRYFGGKTVEYCYNPTAMSSEVDALGYAVDLTQAGTQKLGRITAEVNELVEHLRDAVKQVGKRGKVIHIAHSQGALITSLAATKLTPLEMNQIEVLTFGGAAAIRRTPRTPFSRVINYYSVNDPLLLVVPAAAQALRSGFVDEEFCFLAPRIGDPIRDHNLIGPTYAQALAWEGRRFQTKYQNIFYRTTRTLILFVIALLRAFSERLRELVAAILRIAIVPLIRFLIYMGHMLQDSMSVDVWKKQALALFLVINALLSDSIRLLFQREEYQPALVAVKLAVEEVKHEKA